MGRRPLVQMKNNQTQPVLINKEIVEKSLCGVGSLKSIGYLPLRTITEFLKLNVDSLCQQFLQKGMSVRIINERDTCIQSGVFVVFDADMIVACCKRHNIASSMGKARSVEKVIKILFSEWYEPDNKLMPFIRDLYGDIG